MRKILIGLAILGAGTLIVLSARNGLREHAVPAAMADAAAVVGGEPEKMAVDTSGRISTEGLRRTDREPTHSVEGPAPLPAGPSQASGQSPAPTQTSPATQNREAAEGSTSTQDPEIEAVLRRAAGVYAGARSLQADFSQRSMNPILRTTVASSGTLFQRRPDRFLMRFSDPAGDLIVSDGSHFWVYYPSVDRRQVLRMPASMGAGGVDLQAQFVGDPLERFAVVSEGREEVSGRSAHVLLLTPRQPIGYRSLKIWVDAGDYLVRRFEVTEESGMVRYFELSNLRLNTNLADDLFHFTPPEGTHVVDRG